MTLTPTVTGTPEPTETPLTLPNGCKFQSLFAEIDKDYSVLTFRCPNILQAKGEGVGVSD
jgi:hypothetical protein